MTNKCPKCGSTDLNILYKKSGEYDFYYKVTVKKEHLLKKCKTCQYAWRENTISKDEKESE